MQFRIHFLAIISFVSAFVINAVTVDSHQLVQWAEIEGLGYKTANLMQLQELTKSMQDKLTEGYQVQVPQFYGISADQIEKVLYHKNVVSGHHKLHQRHDAKSAPIIEDTVDLKAEWQSIVDKTVSPEMKQTHMVTPEFIKACEELAQKIEDKFNEAAYVIEKMPSTNAHHRPATFRQDNKCWIDLAVIGFDQNVASAIEQLVREVALNKGLVTLRSTGLREDTEKLANAGGNESCEIVRSTLAETVRNMGVVAASYLKAKSLLQRSGKDEKIFEQPQLPVLLQEVVGELKNNLVVSCVAYSRERQGNTEGVSSSQCNYGHGKAVVDSLFPFDTFYVDDATKASYPVIRVKTKRLVPSFGTKFELRTVENNKELQRKATLDKDAQQAIHIIMMELEKAYGKSMDVELVVDPAKKIVYLVQARPIVYEQQKIKPLYVSETVTFDPEKIITSQKIYVTGTVYLLKADDIYVTTNLESGLKTVLDAEGAQHKVPHVIVVKEPGAITSHAGATLAGKGIVLLQIDDTKQLSDMLNKKDTDWLIDSQRALLVDSTGDDRFVGKDEAALLQKGFLKAGWYSHPIPAVMSVEGAAQQNLDAAIAEYAKRDGSRADKSIEDLLNLLKEAPQDQAKAALESILIRVAKDIEKLKEEQICKDVEATCKGNPDQDVCKIQNKLGTCFKEKAATEAINNMKKVFNQLLVVSDNVKQVLQLPSRSVPRLLHINFLEALLKQMPSAAVVDALSIAHIKESYDKEVGFILAQHGTIDASLFANHELLLIAQKGADASPTNEAEQAWIQFVSQLGKTISPDAINTFIDMVNTIDELGALPVWVYVRVVPMLEQEPNANKVNSELLKEFNDSRTFITQLHNLKNQLEAIDITAWSDPKKFEKNLKNFKAQILDYVESPQFLSIFAQDSNQLFARMVAGVIMRDLVEKFDTIIKTVKASNGYKNDEQKVGDFKNLIQHYYTLLSFWAPMIPADIVESYNSAVSHSKAKEIVDYYLALLKKYLDSKPVNVSQFNPAGGFDSQSLTLAAYLVNFQSKNFEKCTLENIFTIVHQSLEMTLASLAQKMNSAVKLPGLMKKADEIIRRPLVRMGEKAIVTGTNITKDKIVIYYNVPLGEHSATLMLSWFKQKPGVEIKYAWYANKRGHAEAAAFTGMLIGAVYGIQVKDVIIDPPAAIVTHYIGQENLLEHIGDYMNVVTYCQIPAHRCPDNYEGKYLKKVALEGLRKGVPDLDGLLILLNLLNDQEIQDIFGKERIIELCLRRINDENDYVRSNAIQLLYTFVTQDKNLLITLWEKVKYKDVASRLAILDVLEKLINSNESNVRWLIQENDQEAIRFWKPLGQQWWSIAAAAYQSGNVTLVEKAVDLFYDLRSSFLIDDTMLLSQMGVMIHDSNVNVLVFVYTYIKSFLRKKGITPDVRIQYNLDYLKYLTNEEELQKKLKEIHEQLSNAFAIIQTKYKVEQLKL